MAWQLRFIVFATKPANLACFFGRGLLAFAVGDQLNADHQTQSADFADQRVASGEFA